MYRVRDESQQCLANSTLFNKLNSLMRPTLHNKHIQCSSSDGLLIPKINKLFSSKSWGFEPTARAGILFPLVELADFESRNRQWFKTEFHIVMDSFSFHKAWRWGMLLSFIHLVFPFFFSSCICDAVFGVNNRVFP